MDGILTAFYRRSTGGILQALFDSSHQWPSDHRTLAPAGGSLA
jgi:hypothetical protein